jgi:hypothetical protein
MESDLLVYNFTIGQKDLSKKSDGMESSDSTPRDTTTDQRVIGLD